MAFFGFGKKEKDKMKTGLEKTRTGFWGSIMNTLTGSVIDDEMYDDLEEKLILADASKVNYDKDTRKISFDRDGMEIDLGGIAKGYTSAQIMQIYQDCGVTSGLVNLGGNVQALGCKTDGSKWKVAIQSPDDTEDYLGILEIENQAVITSGGYEPVSYTHLTLPTKLEV